MQLKKINMNLPLSNNISLTLKNLFLIIFITIINQSCTSSIEVAANLGKKYILPKDNKKINPIPIYKIGKKYEVRGKFYFPKKDMLYSKKGIASWYGPKFHGKLTANGEIYNQNELTAAHKTLPMPSAVKVTNLENNKSLYLRINDRGPFVNDRIIDLSSKAADLLGLKMQGTGLVRVTVLQEQTKELEKLAKKGFFPELRDLPKSDTPNIQKPQKTKVKVEGIKKKYIKYEKKINYDLKNLKGNYKIFIKLGSFTSLKSAKIMKNKLNYVKNIKIYNVSKNNKNLFHVKSGPYVIINKVDKILSLLVSRGMQGAKIIIE